MLQRTVDTHVHVWNFDKAEYSWLKGNTSILNRNYDIEELEEERTKAGITDGILVQAAVNFEETDFLFEVASIFLVIVHLLFSGQDHSSLNHPKVLKFYVR